MHKLKLVCVKFGLQYVLWYWREKFERYETMGHYLNNFINVFTGTDFT